MKKGIVCVLLGIFFSTFYIEIQSIRILPMLLCFAMMGAGTQLLHKLVKTRDIHNPALTCCCVLILGSALQTMLASSETMRAYTWIMDVIMMILFVYYIYALLELINAYTEQTGIASPRHTNLFQKGIVLSFTLTVVLYCVHVFLPLKAFVHAYLVFGMLAKLMILYILFQWARCSFIKDKG